MSESRFVATYGIDHEDWARMYNAQDRKCGACRDHLKVDKGTHIDHCHDTGLVRGLLCFRCNVALGFLKDSPRRAVSLVQYLFEAEDKAASEAAKYVPQRPPKDEKVRSKKSSDTLSGNLGVPHLADQLVRLWVKSGRPDRLSVSDLVKSAGITQAVLGRALTRAGFLRRRFRIKSRGVQGWFYVPTDAVRAAAARLTDA